MGESEIFAWTISRGASPHFWSVSGWVLSHSANKQVCNSPIFPLSSSTKPLKVVQKCNFALSSWKMDDVLKIHSLKGTICCFKILTSLSASLIPRWHLPKTHIHTFGFVADNSLDGPFWYFSLEHWFPPKVWDTDFFDHNANFRCLMVHPWSLWAQQELSFFFFCTVNF